MRRTILVSFALAVAACGGSSSDTTATTDVVDQGPTDAATFFLTEADDGAILRVQPGDEIAARLSTDGPRWELDEAPDPAILAGGDSFVFEPSEGGTAAGYQEFSFTAAGEGSTTITIVRGSGESLTFTVEVAG